MRLVEEDNFKVQDNVINVPFQLSAEICRCYWRGMPFEDIALVCGTSPRVIRAIVRARQREMLRAKYLGDKELA